MFTGRTARLAALVAFGWLALAGAARGQDIPGLDDGPCGTPPPASPKRIKGGEGFPPLPLPVTPLRRTERKRDPAPPTLIGKITWGEVRTKRFPDGQEMKYADWNLDPNDVHRLLRHVTQAIRVKYKAEAIRLEGFSFDPAEIPFLYITGVRPISFSDGVRKKLRSYIERGGFLMGDACRGSEFFSRSFREEMAKIFPDRPLHVLPPDHPLFRSHLRLDRIAYSPAVKDRPNGEPFVEGLRIGCRIAAILTPYGLSCAWDSDHVPPGSRCVMGRSAHDMGLNIVGYVLAYYHLARFYGGVGMAEIVGENPSEAADFAFAQIRHGGYYDPDPTAFANLIRAVMRDTSIGVRLRREVATLTDPDLRSHPFIYMTGHDDVRLSDGEVAGLQRFLRNGGFLLADACCGNLTFDIAFRREMKKVVPGAELKELPMDHPIYASFHRITKVEYTPAVKATYQGLSTPFLEGIDLDGTTRIVYSRFDLGNGWEREEHPYSNGLASADALRIGTNAILYAMTH